MQMTEQNTWTRTNYSITYASDLIIQADSFHSKSVSLSILLHQLFSHQTRTADFVGGWGCTLIIRETSFYYDRGRLSLSRYAMVPLTTGIPEARRV